MQTLVSTAKDNNDDDNCPTGEPDGKFFWLRWTAARWELYPPDIRKDRVAMRGSPTKSQDRLFVPSPLGSSWVLRRLRRHGDSRLGRTDLKLTSTAPIAAEKPSTLEPSSSLRGFSRLTPAEFVRILAALVEVVSNQAGGAGRTSIAYSASGLPTGVAPVTAQTRAQPERGRYVGMPCYFSSCRV